MGANVCYKFFPAAYPRVKHFQERLTSLHHRLNNVLGRQSLEQLDWKSTCRDEVSRRARLLEASPVVWVFGPLCEALNVSDIVQKVDNCRQEQVRVTSPDQIWARLCDKDALQVVVCTAQLDQNATIPQSVTKDLQQLFQNLPCEQHEQVLFLFDVPHQSIQQETTDLKMWMVEILEAHGIPSKVEQIFFKKNIHVLSGAICSQLEWKFIDIFMLVDAFVLPYAKPDRGPVYQSLKSVKERMINKTQKVFENILGLVDYLLCEMPSSDDLRDRLMDDIINKCACLLVQELSLRYSIPQTMVVSVVKKEELIKDMKALISSTTISHLEDLMPENYKDQTVLEEIFRSTSTAQLYLMEKGESRCRFLAYLLIQDAADVLEKAERKVKDTRCDLTVLHRFHFEIDGLLSETIAPSRHNINRHLEEQKRRLPKELKKALMNHNEVYGVCTYGGKLHIQIMGSGRGEREEEKLKNDLRNLLRVHRYPYDCSIDTVLRVAKRHSVYGVGRKIRSKEKNLAKVKWRNGTLGGFFVSESNVSQGHLYGLTCAHVVENTDKVDIVDKQGNEEIAVVFSTEVYCHKSNTLNQDPVDIAAIKVADTQIEKCAKHFRDKEGSPCPARLFEDIPATVLNKVVFKFGAYTQLTTGIVGAWDFCSSNLGFSEDVILISAENGSDSPTFCTDGDSGSIVCSKSPDGNVIVLISMIYAGDLQVREEDGPLMKFGLSFPLNKGVQALEKVHSLQLRICQHG